MHQFVKLARTYLKPYWLLITFSILLTCLSSMAPYVFSFMGKTIVDDVLELKATPPKSPDADTADPTSPTAALKHAYPEPEKPDTLDNIFMQRTAKTSSQKFHLLAIFFVAYVCIHVFLAILRWLSWYNTSIIGQKIVFRLRTDLHDKLQALQMTYFDQVQTGRIMARVIDDVDVIRGNVTHTVIQFATNVTMLIVGCIILYSIHWRMAVVATFCLPLYAISYSFFVRRIREKTRKVREINSRIYGYLQQKISGIRVVKSFGQEKMEQLRYRRMAGEFLKTVLRRDVLQTLLGGIATIISGVGTALVLWYGAALVRDGSLTIGEMLFFHATVGCLFGPVIQIADTNVTLQWLIVVIARVFEVLDEEVTIKDRPNAVNLHEVKGLVEFRNVSLKYKAPDPRLLAQDAGSPHGRGFGGGGGHRHGPRFEAQQPQTPPPEAESKPQTYALHNVNIKIEPGQTVCVMGASGSGKSTLASALLRLYDPTEGQILIDGQDIMDVRLISLRRHIGLVPQESAIFSGTIADNIRYGAPYAEMEDLIEAAKVAEIHSFIDELPDKYETKIGEQGVSLSGGQKQRLSIARALVSHPSILVLDDCTSALDAHTEMKIQETLAKVLSTRSSIVITHRTSMATKADRIVVLDAGSVVEDGTHEDLLAAHGHYWRMFRSQQKAVHPAAS
ncbi:MAG TPA: ABC transporter ATP-binding protein [Planctomycetota bacterium]|nr:ABC transporter ATP-binding protein [Planctomycetota bacterium]